MITKYDLTESVDDKNGKRSNKGETLGYRLKILKYLNWLEVWAKKWKKWQGWI